MSADSLGSLDTRRDKRPHYQDYECTNDRSNEPSAFASLIPPDRLAKICCYKSSNNPSRVVKIKPLGSYLFPG